MKAEGALLFPIAARVYCARQWSGVHTNPKFDDIRVRYRTILQRLEYRYTDSSKPRGGITVSDKLGRLGSSRLFGSTGRRASRTRN
jgi:hypothetical protein